MRLPRKIKIGAIDYATSFKKDLNHSAGAPGIINFWKRFIRIDPDCCVPHTTMHEIVHGIAHGWQVDLSENDNDRLAQGFLCFMKDNPKLVMSLLEDLEG